jgi:hypothetical protein
MKTYPDALKTVRNAGILTGIQEPAKPAAETNKQLSLSQAFPAAFSNTPFNFYRGYNSLFLP